MSSPFKSALLSPLKRVRDLFRSSSRDEDATDQPEDLWAGVNITPQWPPQFIPSDVELPNNSQSELDSDYDDDRYSFPFQTAEEDVFVVPEDVEENVGEDDDDDDDAKEGKKKKKSKKKDSVLKKFVKVTRRAYRKPGKKVLPITKRKYLVIAKDFFVCFF